MAREDLLQKDQVERRVFAKFAEVCPIRVRMDSIQSRPEPEPDILCVTGTDESIAFELVRCDSSAASHIKSRFVVEDCLPEVPSDIRTERGIPAPHAGASNLPVL